MKQLIIASLCCVRNRILECCRNRTCKCCPALKNVLNFFVQGIFERRKATYETKFWRKKCFELFYFISLFIFWHSGDDPSHRNLKHRTRELPLADVAESCSKLKIPFFQLNRTLKDFLIFIKYHCTPFSAFYILKFKINAQNFKSYFVTWVFFSVFEEFDKTISRARSVFRRFLWFQLNRLI